jgi:hypothetical protein
MDDDVPYPRFLSRGRAFAYVLPCRNEDVAKIGFSRDPLQRLLTLHRRFFAFFDLDRALLVETGSVRDARAIERQIITTFSAYRTPAPFEVPEPAGGRTEWYGGIHLELLQSARTICEAGGFTLHEPLTRWLRDRLSAVTDGLFDWSARMLEAVEFERHNVPAIDQTRQYERVLRDVLDAHSALRLDLQPLVPAQVFAWYLADSLRI